MKPWKQPRKFDEPIPRTVDGPAIRPWKQPTRRFDDPRPDPPGFTPQHVAARLAIHESCHATANYLLGMRVTSIQIGETEGVVHVEQHEDSFDRCVALLAPHAIEDALGLPRSGDGSDDDRVDSILRSLVAQSAIPAARAVLEEAADKLVGSGAFDSLRRTLSSHLKPGTVLTGDEVDEILAPAFEAYNATHGTRSVGRSAPERHSAAPPLSPWYIVSVGKRELYRGPSYEQAKRVQAQHPRSMLVGSLWGGDDHLG